MAPRKQQSASSASSAEALPHVKLPQRHAPASAVCLDAALDRLDASPLDAPRALEAVLGRPVLKREIQARAEARERYRARTASLLRAPGIAQRTPAWYAARQTMVTASDIAQALDCAKFGTQRDFFQKKCGADEEQKPFNASIPPLKWGIMFEAVANAIYARRNMCAVHEFGLLRHATVPFLGASPDGINDRGVMLEIKCPWRRKITGEIPDQYYYQIQGQLEVCGLDECDYLECGFREEFSAAELFAALDADKDGLAGDDDDDPGARGVFLERQAPAPSSASDPPQYVYAPLGLSRGELQAWADAALACGGQSARLRWWRLFDYSCVRVVRDPAFVAAMLPLLEEVWGRVLRYRGDRGAYLAEVGAAAVATPSSQQTQSPSRGGPILAYAFVNEDDEGDQPCPT